MTDVTKPGRPGISEQQYIAQLQEWLDDGHRLVDITATTLQKAVGGQYRKAAEILERFKEGYETRELTELPPLPEKLQGLLNSTGLEMWRVVMDEKREQLAEASAAFDAEKLQLQALADERLALIDELEAREAELRSTLANAQTQLDERTNSWHQLKGANEGLTARNAELKERLQEKTQRVEHLEPLLEKQTGANVELSSQLKDKQQDLGRALGELKQLKAEHEKLKGDLVTADHFVEKAQVEIPKLEQQVAMLQQQVEQQHEAATSMRRELQTAAQSREKIIAELASKATEAEQAGKAVATLQKQLDKLQGELVAIAKKAK